MDGDYRPGNDAAAIIIPKVEEAPATPEAAAAGAAAAAEPEVIKQGKKDEEGAEAAPGPGGKRRESSVIWGLTPRENGGRTALKLIVGLGNPGREYEHTRHNVGFQVAEELADRYHVTLRNHAKWKARAAKISEIGDGILLAEPTTFMNLSGWAVREIADFHKLAPADVLVVVDDADLPLDVAVAHGRSAVGIMG